MFLAFLFALTTSLDSFLTGLSYGTSKIEIKWKSILLLNLVSTCVIAISLCMGEGMKTFLPKESLPLLCFLFLFGLGLFRCTDGLIKNYIRKRGTLKNKYHFSFLSLEFILTVYFDPRKADVDHSHSLSVKEAISLGLALSLDGLFIGLGAALKSVNLILTISLTFVLGSFLLLVGYLIGKKWRAYSPYDLTFIGGILLIVLAFLRR